MGATHEPHEVRVTLFLLCTVRVRACGVGWSLKAVVPAGERAGGQRAGDARGVCAGLLQQAGPEDPAHTQAAQAITGELGWSQGHIFHLPMNTYTHTRTHTHTHTHTHR